MYALTRALQRRGGASTRQALRLRHHLGRDWPYTRWCACFRVYASGCTYSLLAGLDITYESLAKAFDQPLEHHQETLRRMNEMIKYRTDIANQTDEQRKARERMALFPARAEVLYIAPDVWVVSLQVRS